MIFLINASLFCKSFPPCCFSSGESSFAKFLNCGACGSLLIVTIISPFISVTSSVILLFIKDLIWFLSSSEIECSPSWNSIGEIVFSLWITSVVSGVLIPKSFSTLLANAL
jgi:hypothetical protein